MTRLKLIEKMKKLLTIIMLVISGLVHAQVPEPATPQKGSILLRNGVAHLGNGEIIENAFISIIDGKIGVCADARLVRMDISQFDEVFDVSGKHIYPGLILPNSIVGLSEIDAVRATLDYSEVGGMNPNVRSLIAYNTDSELIPTYKFNGILIAQAIPTSGRISGTSSIMKLDGWNWEDAAYKTDDGVHLNWPSKRLGARWWLGETEPKDNEKYDEQVEEVTNIFNDAKSYGNLSAREPNLKLAALQGVLDGSQQLFIHVNKRDEIIESIQWAVQMGIKKYVLVGARDAYYAIDFIKKNNVPVLLTDVHRIPSRPEEDVDLSYKLPGMLHKEGVLVGLTYSNGMPSNARNLPFYAGTAAAHGLEKEEALKFVTSNTAKILGIDKMTGTIEGGKDANIVISTGDLLDMRTNNIEMAFIQGRRLNLEGKQQVLYKRFQKKYSE